MSGLIVWKNLSPCLARALGPEVPSYFSITLAIHGRHKLNQVGFNTKRRGRHGRRSGGMMVAHVRSKLSERRPVDGPYLAHVGPGIDAAGDAGEARIRGPAAM